MRLIFAFSIIFFCSCSQKHDSSPVTETKIPLQPYILVLGVAQDAGYPQIGCKKNCCQAVWKGEISSRYTVSLALIDPVSKQKWLFEATPDIKFQIEHLNRFTPDFEKLNGIFISHAHIGHYTGLMHLGREAMGAKSVPVFALPRLVNYLTENGPWSQLVDLENIQLSRLSSGKAIILNKRCSVRPMIVPHRDEFSETAGFIIQFGDKKALFIPDIDKWENWEMDISSAIAKVDYAFLDATFYDGNELPGRDMAEIPHPFVIESMGLFSTLSDFEKAKVHFIHLNHTNPLLNNNSAEYKSVQDSGFQIAQEGKVYQ